MTPRTRGMAVIALLLILAVAIPTLLAFQAGQWVARHDLERRIERVEVDLQIVSEDVGKLLE